MSSHARFWRGVGRRIAQARRDRNLTQERLAELAGIETSFLSRVEIGDRGVSVETLTKIAEVTRVRAGYLLGEVTDGGPAVERMTALVRDMPPKLVEVMLGLGEILKAAWPGRRPATKRGRRR